MAKHDPKTSLAQIIRYNKDNPDEYEVVAKVNGKPAVIRKLGKLRKEETANYAYYWTWVDVDAAQEYERAKLLRKRQ